MEDQDHRGAGRRGGTRRRAGRLRDPSGRDARICVTAADPVAIANQAGATSLGGPVPEGNDSCILSADGTNATRTGTWDFGPGGQQITVTTYSSRPTP